MPRGDVRDRQGAPVLAARIPGRWRGEAMVAAFRDPRTTTVLPLGAAAAEAVALAIASEARRGATVVLTDAAAAPAVRDALARTLPGADVYACDVDHVYRFLWHYRDHHDPLTLGHAGPRDVLGFVWEGCRPPRFRQAKDRFEQRRTLAQVRELLFTMGNALGVRPPIPSPEGDTPGWGLRRILDLVDAVLALYVGLLYRWGSPLVTVEPGPLPTLVLPG